MSDNRLDLNDDNLRAMLSPRDLAELASEQSWDAVNEHGQIMGEFGPLSDDALRRVAGYEVNSTDDVVVELLEAQARKNRIWFEECDRVLAGTIQLGHGSGVTIAKEAGKSTETIRKMRRFAELVPGYVREEGVLLVQEVFHEAVKLEVSEREALKEGETHYGPEGDQRRRHAGRGIVTLRRGIRDGLESSDLLERLKTAAEKPIWVSGGSFDLSPDNPAAIDEVLAYVAREARTSKRVKLIIRVQR